VCKYLKAFIAFLLAGQEIFIHIREWQMQTLANYGLFKALKTF